MDKKFAVNGEFDLQMFCSNLGSKVTNRRRGSFPRGHDQRSRFQIFSNVRCLPASTLLVAYENTLLSYVLR